MDGSPSWPSGFGGGRRRIRRCIIPRWSRWSSARWPGTTTILREVRFPRKGMTSKQHKEDRERTHQSGSNSPPGRYFERKVSKAPNSLWCCQNPSTRGRSGSSQLNIPLFFSEFSNFVQEHTDLVRKRLAELVEILSWCELTQGQHEINDLPLVRCRELARSRFHGWRPWFLHDSWPYHSSSSRPSDPTVHVVPRFGEQAPPRHVRSLRNLRITFKTGAKLTYLVEIQQRSFPLPCEPSRFPCLR